MIKLSIFLIIVSLLTYFLIAKRLALRTFFKEVQFEMAKVSWPTGDEVVNSTILVGIIVILLGIMCFIVDSIFMGILKSVF